MGISTFHFLAMMDTYMDTKQFTGKSHSP